MKHLDRDRSEVSGQISDVSSVDKPLSVPDDALDIIKNEALGAVLPNVIALSVAGGAYLTQIILEFFGVLDVFVIWLLTEVVLWGACVVAAVGFTCYCIETVNRRVKKMKKRLTGGSDD